MEIDGYRWSEWVSFPDPRNDDILHAPFGCGVYQIRDTRDSSYVLFGSGNNLAYRMSSLLPHPHGCGTRRNQDKRQYMLRYLESMEYRTIACDKKSAKKIEQHLKALNRHRFNT